MASPQAIFLTLEGYFSEIAHYSTHQQCLRRLSEQICGVSKVEVRFVALFG
jgi:hypothetical protein